MNTRWNSLAIVFLSLGLSLTVVHTTLVSARVSELQKLCIANGDNIHGLTECLKALEAVYGHSTTNRTASVHWEADDTGTGSGAYQRSNGLWQFCKDGHDIGVPMALAPPGTTIWITNQLGIWRVTHEKIERLP